MNVLLVGQIFEIRILVDSLASGRIQPVSSAVFVRAVGHVGTDGENGEHVRAQDGSHSQGIERRLVGLEKLRGDDVGDAVCDEN